MTAKLPTLFFYLIILAPSSVIPVPSSVIPAKAGIQGKTGCSEYKLNKFLLALTLRRRHKDYKGKYKKKNQEVSNSAITKKVEKGKLSERIGHKV